MKVIRELAHRLQLIASRAIVVVGVEEDVVDRNTDVVGECVVVGGCMVKDSQLQTSPPLRRRTHACERYSGR